MIATALFMPEQAEPASQCHEPVMVPFTNRTIQEEKQIESYRNAVRTSLASPEEHREGAGGYQGAPEADSGTVLKLVGTKDENTGGVEEGAGEPDEPVRGPEDPVLTYLGEWTTTAYCPCEECCGPWATGYTASGTLATAGRTVACGVLPFGTQIVIDGVIYTVEDTGVEGEWVDIFFDTHEEALNYGMQTKSVYLLEG